MQTGKILHISQMFMAMRDYKLETVDTENRDWQTCYVPALASAGARTIEVAGPADLGPRN